MGTNNNVLSLYSTKSSKSRGEALNNEAFIKLIQSNKISLYRLAKSIVKNEYEIEDAISETILKAFKNFDRLNSLNSFRPWIMRILVNECYNILKEKKRVTLEENMEVYNLTEEDEHQNELIFTINRLQKDFRTILILFYYEDMSIKDLSNILNISQGTVKSRLSRAKAKLKILLEEV